MPSGAEFVRLGKCAVGLGCNLASVGRRHSFWLADASHNSPYLDPLGSGCLDHKVKDALGIEVPAKLDIEQGEAILGPGMQAGV